MRPSEILGRTRTALRERRRTRSAGRATASRRVTAALSVVLLGQLALVAVLYLHIAPEAPGRKLPFDGFVRLATEQRIERVTLLDEDARLHVHATRGRQYWVSYPKSDAATATLLDDLVDAGVQVEVDAQAGKSAARMALTTLIPLLVLANLFALVVTGSRGGGSAIGEVITFGTIGQRKLRRGQARAVSFGDVGAAGEAVVELREVVDYLSNPARYEALGAAPPKGVLLVGPPGCGKTLLAKAVAGEAGVPFVSVAGAEFVESLVGVGAARVRDLFARVRAVAPAIVFIDELDAAGRRRGTGDGGSEERDQTLNQLLVEMDGFDVSKGIVVMAATNRPDIIDPALLRPGRFDRHVTIPLPDPVGRAEILALHARSKPVAADVDLESLARRTPGFSGADLANVVNEATLLAIRDGRTTVLATDFEEAVRRVEGGPQRRGQVVHEEQRRRLATYEAARAVAAVAVGRGDDVHRVSLLDRAHGIGGNVAGADADAVLLSTSQLEARLVVAVAGAAAERAAFGDISTHGERDMHEATTVARDMVGRYGMTERLGQVRLVGATSDHLGGSPAPEGISEATHALLDAEVRRLVDEAGAAARDVLAANDAVIADLVERLMEAEHVEGEALEAVLAKVTPVTPAAAGATRSRAPRHRAGARART